MNANQQRREIQRGQHPLRTARHYIPPRAADDGPAPLHHGRDLERPRQDHVTGGAELVRVQGHRPNRRGEDARAGARELGGPEMEPVARGGGGARCRSEEDQEAVRAEYFPVHMRERNPACDR